MVHCWPGCIVGLHWCVSLLVRLVARLVLLKTNCVLSTENMRLVVRPRLRAVPVLAAAAVSPAMADILATTARVSRALADCSLAPWSATTANLAMISVFVFVCAPPTSEAIGGRHCS